MGTSFVTGSALPGVSPVAEKKPEIKHPAQYQVVLLNDDYTPMDFVVSVLQQYFGMQFTQALKVMLDVHHQGKGICGTYTKEIAETKVAQVMEVARVHEHPLLCQMEKL